ncbi:MAG: carbon-nitrogen hydrolase family protein [Ktedonobacterales bacterium]
MPDLRIGLVQMRCEKGTIAANLGAIASHLRDGAGQGAEIMCFPEGSITGYVVPTRYPEAVVQLDGPEVAQFVALTRAVPVTAIAGIIESNPDGKPFITQVVARDGRLLGFYHKRMIPYDESAVYASGSDCAVFSHRNVTFGVAICADIDDAAIFEEATQQGARLIFEAAAPGLYGSQETRNWRAGFEWWRGECCSKLATYARDNHVFIAVATQAGRTGDEDFPGGGYVFGPDGNCLHATPDWLEGVLYATLQLDQ